MDFIYKFPVVKGVQAGKEYYIAMVPLNMLTKLFPSNEDEFVLPEYRAQRKLNEARIPVISKYILENRDSYVFSALAASIDGKYKFMPSGLNNDTGMLEVSMDSKFLINDGQHRKSAILEALREDESLGDETISIVFYADKGLERSQQIFTDLNKNAVKTSNSIAELYDSRDEMAVMTRNVIWNIEFLNLYTDKEKDILGKFSSSLFTLNTFYTANKLIVGRNIGKNAEAFLNEYWSHIVKNMQQWQELQNKEITKVDLRENYIATQSIVIQALGRVGNYFYVHSDVNMDEYIERLGNINWNRNSKTWLMRAIGKNGRIITNKKATLLIGNIIKIEMGIPLSQEELDAEESHKKIV
ncbi:DNA sulfur modification protein DndB [Anaerocolumna xylanovorans]|uniref:DNA sulfur modification protein DndB n=1 Tax=Anaerocolumna xylanovorans DSM 12503 TaxID=1121345 RepID=A0A1M7YLA6_9FIRM|nr:DNA sulfur modification protein DndB [Anaerocolumna xylanovorans]SHO53386.1 DNA sulfur modification protein DndB [Anaerocolumna xylanovorans DSM 12503]